MEAAPRRVRTIYSVIASPQRLEILKILNVKGPLTYSALKSLAGFKSKKESGKFAYHLRKLVRQLLIQLNRQERKYTATNLGRLVLNLTRQIEEQSLIESGKLYVRTTRQAMEEFNADKILQSLVKEAGMPVELAQKITSETESRLYKFQTQYLTAPLIREMVNALLVEHSLEEYRHKLTRLGMPIYDVTQLLNKVGDDGGNVESLVHMTGGAVFSEYLLLEQLPRDVADAHLAGDIHISNAGVWGLMPDTVFVDLLSVRASGFNPRGRLAYAPMLPTPENAEKALGIISNLSLLMDREVSVEVTFRNFLQYLAPYCRSRTKRELEAMILRFLESVTGGMSTPQRRTATLELNPFKHDEDGADQMEKTLDATLATYRDLGAGTRFGGGDARDDAPDHELRGAGGGADRPDKGPRDGVASGSRREDCADRISNRGREIREERKAGGGDARGGRGWEAREPGLRQVRKGEHSAAAEVGVLTIASDGCRRLRQPGEGGVHQQTLV